VTEVADRVADFVRQTVDRQGFAHLLGYKVTGVGVGWAEMKLEPGPQHSQQQGYIHGGVFATMADVCAGCAAVTLAPHGTEVLTIEFKMNYLRPAKDGTVVVRAHVVKAGRTISVMESDVFVVADRDETLVAKALVTFTLFRPDDPG